MSHRVFYLYLITAFVISCHSSEPTSLPKYKKIILDSNKLNYESVISTVKNDNTDDGVSLDVIYKRYLPDSATVLIRKKINDNELTNQERIRLLDSNDYYGNRVYEFDIKTEYNRGFAMYFVRGVGELIFVELMSEGDPANNVSYVLETNDAKTVQLISSIISDTTFFVLSKLNKKTSIQFVDPR